MNKVLEVGSHINIDGVKNTIESFRSSLGGGVMYITYYYDDGVFLKGSWNTSFLGVPKVWVEPVKPAEGSTESLMVKLETLLKEHREARSND